MTSAERLTIRVVPPDWPPVSAADGELVERRGLGLWRVYYDPMSGASDFTRATPRDCAVAAGARALGCATCDAGTPVSHFGFVHCRSGSLASGGRTAHCTCDGCF